MSLEENMLRSTQGQQSMAGGNVGLPGRAGLAAALARAVDRGRIDIVFDATHDSGTERSWSPAYNAFFPTAHEAQHRDFLMPKSSLLSPPPAASTAPGKGATAAPAPKKAKLSHEKRASQVLDGMRLAQQRHDDRAHGRRRRLADIKASLEARGRPLQVRVELREGGAARAAGAGTADVVQVAAAVHPPALGYERAWSGARVCACVRV